MLVLVFFFKVKSRRAALVDYSFDMLAVFDADVGQNCHKNSFCILALSDIISLEISNKQACVWFIMDGTCSGKVDSFLRDYCLIDIVQFRLFQAQEINGLQLKDIVNHLTVHIVEAFQIHQFGFRKIELIQLDKEDHHIIKTQISDSIVEA